MGNPGKQYKYVHLTTKNNCYVTNSKHLKFSFSLCQTMAAFLPQVRFRGKWCACDVGFLFLSCWREIFCFLLNHSYFHYVLKSVIVGCNKSWLCHSLGCSFAKDQAALHLPVLCRSLVSSTTHVLVNHSQCCASFHLSLLEALALWDILCHHRMIDLDTSCVTKL